MKWNTASNNQGNAKSLAMGTALIILKFKDLKLLYLFYKFNKVSFKSF